MLAFGSAGAGPWAAGYGLVGVSVCVSAGVFWLAGA